MLARTLTGHRSCDRQHRSMLVSVPRSAYVDAISPVPHHLVPGPKGITHLYYLTVENIILCIFPLTRNNALQQRQHVRHCAGLRAGFRLDAGRLGFGRLLMLRINVLALAHQLDHLLEADLQRSINGGQLVQEFATLVVVAVKKLVKPLY